MTKRYKVKLTKCECETLNEIAQMPLSEVKALPIECHTQQWGLTITNVLGYVTVGDKCIEVNYVCNR